MRKNSVLQVVLVLGMSALPLAAEVTVTPVASINLLGGQYWVSGSEPATFAGNADVYVAPAINFSPTTALLPIFTGSYSGTKDVRELVGGGTLTREMQDHALALKFIKKMPGNVKLKLRASYKLEYVKETVDETWGKGLFDYQKPMFGIEAEKGWAAWKGRAGIDYFTMHYPNYQSLITDSAFETSLDTTTYTELSTQAGTDVLDYRGMSFFTEGTRQFSEQIAGLVRYDLTVKDFVDQNTVERSGMFSSTNRKDMVHLLTAGVTLVAARATVGINESVQYYDSNQNSLSVDPANAGFTQDYYDFFENTLAPSMTFKLGDIQRPVQLTFFWELAWRQYTERFAQYADGTTKSSKISQLMNTTGCSLRYPLTTSLAARFSVNYRDVVSNMRYEKNYQYNYYNFNYFCGISWEL